MDTKTKSLNIIFTITNTILVICVFYFFLVIGAKYYLTHHEYSKATSLFKASMSPKGEIVSVLQSSDLQNSKYLEKKANSDELRGIYAWGTQNYQKAEDYFQAAQADKLLAYSYFKKGEIAKAQEIAEAANVGPIINQIFLEQNKIDEAIKSIVTKKDQGGYFSLFFKLQNWVSAIIHLHKTGNPLLIQIANVLNRDELKKDQIFKYLRPGSNDSLWFHFLTGNMNKVSEEINESSPKTFHELQTLQKGIRPQEYLGNGVYIEQIFESYQKQNLPHLKLEELRNNSKFKIYDVLPKKISEADFKAKHTNIFKIAFCILLAFIIVSLFFIYRKYQTKMVLQRASELEKMDALSVAKIQSKEALKKRDKTELNVSSFVTLNIQVEVLDVAFTKLGLRPDPKKLAEELEKTKIPNISYKIYTVSNGYGLDVKMQSVEIKELAKLKGAGVVVLVLKGDLIAMLKRVDGKNAYMQFSQKDSRKVPYSALKLSWDGQIIILNTM